MLSLIQLLRSVVEFRIASGFTILSKLRGGLVVNSWREPFCFDGAYPSVLS